MDCRFYLSYFMRIFAMLMLSIECLLTISFVKPGYVGKWLFWMALTSVDLNRKNNTACKKRRDLL